MGYTPIHLHSCFSVRDAVIKVDELAVRCNELGIESCAITDHGFLGAAYKQYKEFTSRNIKPIIGCEFYFTDDASEKEAHYHLILLAKNKEGFQNLNRLSRYSYTEGFYKKPRIDWKSLENYKDGIICSAACVFGFPQQLFLNNETDAAVDTIKKFKRIFNEDYYLEVADHGLEDENKIREWFRNVGSDLGIKCLPATDSHYLKEEDAGFHKIFKQLAYNSVGKDDDDFDGKNYHVLSLEEMKRSFTQEEIDNTLEVAGKCNTKFSFTGYHLPSFKSNDGRDAYEVIGDLTIAALKAKGLDSNKEYIDRLLFEREQLHLASLEDYFLIVYDYINWCKNNNIPVGPGRGSAAGSLVSYLLGITGVDPIKYGLMFTRAINPGRALQFDFGV